MGVLTYQPFHYGSPAALASRIGSGPPPCAWKLTKGSRSCQKKAHVVLPLLWNASAINRSAFQADQRCNFTEACKLGGPRQATDGHRQNGERSGSLSGKGRKEEDQNSRRRYRTMLTRVQSSVYMLIGFGMVIYMGHVFIWLLIMALQFLMVKELFQLSMRAQRQKGSLPGFKVLNWSVRMPS